MQNVSFIIPNYNAENTIAKTIESILKQKYKGKIEVIVIDDKSIDNSLKIISKYKKVRLIKNEKNLGLAKSLNKAIKDSKYDLICLIWCDCVLENNSWLDEMVKVYSSDKKIGTVASKLIIPKEYFEKFSFSDKIILARDYETSLNEKQKEGRPTLFNKKLLSDIGFYDDKAFRIAGEDTDLKWKIINKGYKIVTADAKILHLHGFYNLSLSKQLFKKALPLAEAIGVNFARHGIKSFSSKYWNPLTSTFLYLFLFVPFINILAFLIIVKLILSYTFNSYKYIKDERIFIVPFFKLAKDIVTIIGFWKGFFTGKQEL